MGVSSLGLAPFYSTDNVIGETRGISSELKITEMEVFKIKATSKTKWIFVRLNTNLGLTGLGEATYSVRYEAKELESFFELVYDQSPFDIESYRQRGWIWAKYAGLEAAAAFCAIEHAMWDLVGKALNVSIYNLFGGKLRNEIPVYANINRATIDRSPESFAVNAQKAVGDGFSAIKAAPFDGSVTTEEGIACIAAMREAIGPDVKLLIDCHSNFDVELAITIAEQLEPYNLYWYEEPVAPEKVTETKTIKSSINQSMAGGELLLGMDGFAPLCQNQAVDIIMPDVIYCGGIMEGKMIAAMATVEDNILVSPHNPWGPVSTAACVQLSTGMPNFDILEYQWNEVSWRSDLIIPPEQFQNGMIPVPDRPGLGIELNDEVIREHSDQTTVGNNNQEMFSVDPAYPNPANPATTIGFTLAEADHVTVDIYNIAGQKVDTLIDSKMTAGKHSFIWDSTRFSSGVYFYSVKSGNFSKTMKFTVLK
ncbi:enolase C-terminal domain-like protein [Candidatus Latescibacterota bacterium]